METSDIEESQASQLIQNVLGGVHDSKTRFASVTRKNNVEDSIINDSAESSSTGRNTHGSSHYQLHGLAQTQSDLDKQAIMEEMSQTANIGGGGRPRLPDAVCNQPFPPDPSIKNIRTKSRRQEQQHNQSPTKETKPRSKSNKLPSRDSSFQRVTSQSRNVKLPKPRSPSEDSFAGDAVDPEQHFLASTKQFQMPLSELARPPGTRRRAIVEDNSDASKPTYLPLIRSARESYSPPNGKILVPDSDCSPSPDSQLVYKTHRPNHRSEHVEAEHVPNSQNSNPSSPSTPGSSLYGSRGQEPQADDLQATQPTAESDEADMSLEPDPSWLLAAAKASGPPTASDNPTPGSSIKSNETKSTTSSNRGILSLIHPKNKWRFQRYQQIVSGDQSARRGDPENGCVGPPQELGFEETQPSHEDDTFLIPRDNPSNHSAPRGVGINMDATDVVPDSEPSREEPPSMVIDVRPKVDNKGISKRQDPGWKRGKRVISPRRTIDDHSSDDDDIPLAQISTKPPPKGKEHDPAFKVPSAGVSRPVRTRGGVTESAEIPSSLPEQDALNMRARSSRLVANDSKPHGADAVNHKRVPMPTHHTLERLEEEEVEESEDDPRSKQAESDDLEDDDYQEVNAQNSSRKRKRGLVPKDRVARRSGPTTRGARSTTLVTRTASIRQTKKLRSMTNSSVKATNEDATRVFALWRQDGHFYSGTIHMLQGDSRYLVKFDDDTEAAVSLEQMRLCQLRIGDDVLLPGRTRSSKVLDVPNLQGGVIIVDTDGDPEEIEIRSIRVASRTIKSAWKDRLLTADGIFPEIPPIKKGGSPTPSGMSLASAPSSKSSRKKFLCKTGLAVSLSAGKSNWEKEKELLLNTIRNNGGVVLDDWTSVVRMEGKHSASNNRWVLTREEIQWCGKEDIERVFLLADDSSQKPKFLMAIGLGIPCLSVNWLHDSIAAGEEKEWTAYMLPQGYSDRLSARISQQVDVDWGNSVHQLTDIMDNAVPAKPLKNKSILCVGSDMVPPPKGKRFAGTDEKVQEASNAVARIILCMGARRVEAVTDMRYASSHAHDYIVVKDSCTNTFDGKGRPVVPWSWVKDCLVASRRFSIQEDEATSQEA